MTIDEAIKAMQNIDLVLSVTDSEHEAARMAISALRAQQERENPQPSTNADRIRAMDDEKLAIFLCLEDGEWARRKSALTGSSSQQRRSDNGLCR